MNLWKSSYCCDVHWGARREDAGHYRHFRFNTKCFSGAHCGVPIALRCNICLFFGLFVYCWSQRENDVWPSTFFFLAFGTIDYNSLKILKRKYTIVCIDGNVLTWSAACAHVFIWALCCSHPAHVGTGSKVAIIAFKQKIIVKVRPMNMCFFFFYLLFLSSTLHSLDSSCTVLEVTCPKSMWPGAPGKSL